MHAQYTVLLRLFLPCLTFDRRLLVQNLGETLTHEFNEAAQYPLSDNFRFRPTLLKTVGLGFCGRKVRVGD
jgi:hypothetical protein